MSKKKPDLSEDHEYVSHPPPKQPIRRGKPREPHKGLQACMDDFIKESEAWINHFRDDWFRQPAGPLESPCDAAKCEDALERYADALDTLHVMANCVAKGQWCLEKGQALAKKLLDEKKNPPKEQEPEQSTDVPDEDDDPFRDDEES